MKKYYKNLENGYIFAVSIDYGAVEITESEYNAIMQKIQNKPTEPEGYTYKLRADNLEWELVKLPPVEPEPPTAEDKAEAYDILIGEEETE